MKTVDFTWWPFCFGWLETTNTLSWRFLFWGKKEITRLWIYPATAEISLGWSENDDIIIFPEIKGSKADKNEHFVLHLFFYFSPFFLFRKLKRIRRKERFLNQHKTLFGFLHNLSHHQQLSHTHMTNPLYMRLDLLHIEKIFIILWEYFHVEKNKFCDKTFSNLKKYVVCISS
jgi:hypothetical protein